LIGLFAGNYFWSDEKMIRRCMFMLMIPFTFFTASCALSVNVADVPTSEGVTEEPSIECPPTTAPTLLVCPTPAVTEMPAVELRTAYVSSGNLTLRAGPTVAHPALNSFPMGAAVRILGKVPGGSWVAVSVPGGQLGWMYTQYLGIDLTDPLDDVAVLEPAMSRAIEGRVVDDSGEPVANVGVGVALGGPVDYPDFSDPSGRFVVFVPDNQSGPWTVSIQGVGCQSRLVDENCQLIDHVLRNPRQTVGQGQSESLSFVYEAAAMRLRGHVRDTAGNPYDGAGVFATRSDGAYVTGKANAAGIFDIPITPGTWSVMATRGPSISVTIPQDGYDQELELIGLPN
jgi:hypothetical protein